ncbi:unnamed protein product [Ilex paraguariensis]|uniref:Uncharacterized protein n=1 Tax=Ilex paraguariensis TaxID=185542 RepID=A0ABC8UUM1_9AQUA
MKSETVSPPVGFSQGEDSRCGENKLKEKADTGEVSVNADCKAGALLLPSRKNKTIFKEENEDGTKGEVWTGGFSSSTRPYISQTRKNGEKLHVRKTLQRMKCTSDKNKSKYGRPPSKKPTDRKTSFCTQHVINCGSSDFTGKSFDDHEELLAAANSACNASKVSCSGPFWKKVEYLFASVSFQDAEYLKQRLNRGEELLESLSQIIGDEYDALGLLKHKNVPLYSGGRQENTSTQESVKSDVLFDGFDMGRRFDKVPPLYQRVFSALIEENVSEESYNQNEGRNKSIQCTSDDSHCGSCNLIDVELKDRDRTESEVESEVDLQTQKHCLLDRFSCNRSASPNTNSNRSVSSSLCSNEQWQSDDCLSYPDAGVLPGSCQNDLGLPNSMQVDGSANSSSGCEYQKLSLDDRLLLELQSIGLYPETMPHLVERAEINQDIVELQGGLYQQVGKVQKNLGKIEKAIQRGTVVERR